MSGKTNVCIVWWLIAVVLLGTYLSGCGGDVPTSAAREGGGVPEPTVAPRDDAGTDAKDSSAADVGTTGADKALSSETGTPGTVSAAAARGEKVVDQDEAEKGGTPSYWHRIGGYGWDSDMTWTYVNGTATNNWMRWHSGLSAGTYRVYAFVPRNYATTRSAKYRLEALNSSGTAWNVVANKTIDQYSYSDAWVDLGSYHFSGEPAVYLSDATGESYTGTRRMVGFDGIKWVSSGGGGGSRLLSVTFAPQVPPGSWSKTMSCGPASLNMATAYLWGAQLQQVEYIRRINRYLGKTDIDNCLPGGTSCSDLVRAAKAVCSCPNSYSASGWGLTSLKNAINAGQPVVVAVWAGHLSNRGYSYAKAHFVLVRGYDDGQGVVICNDPGTSRGGGKRYSYTEFTRAMNAQGGAVVVPRR